MSSSNYLDAFSDLGFTTAPSSRFQTHYSMRVTTENHENQTHEHSAASAMVVSSNRHNSLQEWIPIPNLPRTDGFEPHFTVPDNAVTSLLETSSNINGGFRIFQGNLHSMLPTDTQTLLSGSFRNEFEPSCLTTQPVELIDIPSTFNFQGSSMLGHYMPTGYGNSNGAKSCGMMQDNFRAIFTEFYPFELAGNRIPEIDVQQQSGAGFGVFNSVPVLQYHTNPLATRNQCFSEDTRRPSTSPLPYGPSDRFRDDKDSSSEAQDIVLPPLQIPQTNTPIFDNVPRPSSSTTRKRDISQIESKADTSSRSKKAKPAFSYREIAPKGNAISQNIKGSRNNFTRIEQDHSKKKGRRHKPLSPEKSEKATSMREVRACASCFISHAECSDHLVCLRCQKRAEKAAIESPGCLRGPLQFWKGLFFPDLLSGHITPWFLDDWVKKSGMKFTNDCIFVALSADPFGFTIPLVVHEVSIVNQECLVVSDLAVQPGDVSRSFASQNTLPYGYNGDMEQLQRRCLQYINSISKHSLCDIEDITGDTSGIVWKVLKAVWGYTQANTISRKEGILWKALNVFWMNYLLDRCFAFTHDSAMKALQSFHDPSIVFPGTSFISAALLSRQIKLAIHLQFETHIDDLLEELERHSRRNRASWATCFCINLVLCILVELVQIATDAIVVERVSKGKDAADARKSGIEICQALEELPMKYSWTLFHGIQGNHNPIQNGCPIGNDESQSNGEVGLLDTIRQLMHDHVEEITEKTLEPCLGGCSENPTDHARFRAHNSGRHRLSYDSEMSNI